MPQIYSLSLTGLGPDVIPSRLPMPDLSIWIGACLIAIALFARWTAD